MDKKPALYRPVFLTVVSLIIASCLCYITFMAIFSSTKIIQDNETIAEALKLARQHRKLEIADVSSHLQINSTYIEALENGELDKLPPGFYGKNFLKKYARFLGIDHKPLLNMYASLNEGKTGVDEDPFSRKKPRPYYFLIIPKIIRNIIIILIAATCLLYLSFYIKQITSPPLLTIHYPPEDISLNNSLITIKGKTDIEAEVSINGENILTEKDGSFSKELMLKHGLNSISILSQKKYSKESLVIRKIILNDEIN